MTNETKKVKDVFKDYETNGNILECDILNISMFKKSNKLAIELKSSKKIQIGEKLAFEFYLKSKFRVQDVDIQIDVQETKAPSKGKQNKDEKDEQEEVTPVIIGNKKAKITDKIVKVKDINMDSGKVVICGKIIKQEVKELKSGKFLLMMNVFDGSCTIVCKAFLEADVKDKVLNRINSAPRVTVLGNAQYDPFSKEVTIMANVVLEAEAKTEVKRMDRSDEKRVELHMHTQMSQMDGVTPVEDLINRARSWGMKSIAITDHGVVQAFPKANHVVEDNKGDIKVIYGVEAYLVPDGQTSVYNPKNQDLDTEYCVLDIETTGLSFRTEKITELGAIKIKNGKIIDTFECFVNPEKPIPYEVIKVTHITDDMVRDAEKIEQVLPKFLEFAGDDVLVAHNANFDIGFIRHFAELQGLKMDNTYIDTLALARDMFPDYKKYKLGIIADNLGIRVDVAHRALDDVKTLVKVFEVMLRNLKENGITSINDIDNFYSKEIDLKHLSTYHAIILTKNYVGLKNLYKLISFSHLDYFYKKPKIPKSLYKKYSEGLMIGSACDQGELYQSILEGLSEEKIEEIASFYDYLEIQPLGNNEYLIRNGTVENKDGLIEINRKIVALGEKLNKPVVATCDVHFMDPEDEIYRRILMAGQKYDDADLQPPLYLRTTEEMLEEFTYLGRDKAYEVVVTNTNKIADMCEAISPISKEKCPPHIEGCEKTIEDIAMNRAKELYGDPLPEIVEVRLRKELDSIIKNRFLCYVYYCSKARMEIKRRRIFSWFKGICWFFTCSIYDGNNGSKCFKTTL